MAKWNWDNDLKNKIKELFKKKKPRLSAFILSYWLLNPLHESQSWKFWISFDAHTYPASLTKCKSRLPVVYRCQRNIIKMSKSLKGLAETFVLKSYFTQLDVDHGRHGKTATAMESKRCLMISRPCKNALDWTHILRQSIFTVFADCTRWTKHDVLMLLKNIT